MRPLKPGDYYDVTVTIPVCSSWEEDEDAKAPTPMDAVREAMSELRSAPEFYTYEVSEVHGDGKWIVDMASGGTAIAQKKETA